MLRVKTVNGGLLEGLLTDCSSVGLEVMDVLELEADFQLTQTEASDMLMWCVCRGLLCRPGLLT